MNEPDDRILCRWCRFVDEKRFRCIKLEMGVLVELPRRCQSYVPLKSEADQRTGAQRWPRLGIQITEVRAADDAALKA